MGYHAMSYGYEKILNGDKSLSETVDTDKRNTYSAGIDFSLCSNKKHKLFLNSTINLLTGPGETQTTTHIYRTIDKLEGILKARNNYIERFDITIVLIIYFNLLKNINYHYQLIGHILMVCHAVNNLMITIRQPIRLFVRISFIHNLIGKLIFMRY